MSEPNYKDTKCATCVHRNQGGYDETGATREDKGWCGVHNEAPFDIAQCSNFIEEDITEGVRKLLALNPYAVTIEETPDGVPYLLAAFDDGTKKMLIQGGNNEIVDVD